MEIGLFQLILLAAIGVLLLGPREVQRLAGKLGRWMREMQKISQEFSRELQREVELSELQEDSTRPEGKGSSADSERAPKITERSDSEKTVTSSPGAPLPRESDPSNAAPPPLGQPTGPDEAEAGR
jgi:Sec-independent protein translocase protein TatA